MLYLIKHKYRNNLPVLFYKLLPFALIVLITLFLFQTTAYCSKKTIIINEEIDMEAMTEQEILEYDEVDYFNWKWSFSTKQIKAENFTDILNQLQINNDLISRIKDISDSKYVLVKEKISLLSKSRLTSSVLSRIKKMTDSLKVLGQQTDKLRIQMESSKKRIDKYQLNKEYVRLYNELQKYFTLQKNYCKQLKRIIINLDSILEI